MQIRLHVRRTFPFVVVTFVRGDIPKVARRILHSSGSFAIRLINGLGDRCGTGLKRLPVSLVAVRYIHMKSHRRRLAAPRESWTAAAHHQHGVTDADLGMNTARQAYRAESLLSSKCTLHECDQRVCILRYRIGCYRTVPFWHRVDLRSLRLLAHLGAQAAMYLLH